MSDGQDRGQGRGASSGEDRATHKQSPQAVSAVPVGIPSAYLDTMQLYVAEARKQGYWAQRFLLCSDLYRALENNGARPVRLHGVRVDEVDTWAWGWMLMVTKPGLREIAYEPPAQAMSAGTAETASQARGQSPASAVRQDAPQTPEGTHHG